jgi:outer membrane receptor protein involved in Fe transport
LIEPMFVDRVEIVRGPGSAQYGSDAMGGTINVVTRPVLVSAPAFCAAPVHGSLATAFASADLSAGAGAQLAAGGKRWGTSFGLTWRRMQDLRPGGGLDSHSVVTRLLGLPSTVLGRRLQDTAYTQAGASARTFLRPTSDQVITATYLHGTQRGARRYDQLNGGIGNLISDFDPQTLAFGTLRYEKLATGLFDALSATVSYNGQRDGRRSQSVNNSKAGLRSTISDEANQTRVLGGQLLGTATPGGRHRVSFGADLYAERVSSQRWDHAFDTATGDFTKTTQSRARFPDGATYRTTAVFAQDSVDLWRGRLLLSLGGRYSGFRYSQTSEGNPLSAAGNPLVPRFATSFSDTTYDAGLVVNASETVALTARAARGFRAPNVNDFGAIGVSGLGFEISPDEGARLGARAARIGAETGASAAVRQLGPEVLWSYEAGLRVYRPRVSAAAAAFVTEVSHFIERRTVLLASGAVGSLIGGQPVVRQDASGAVYTSLSSNPVFVRANAGRVRTVGFDASLRVKATSSLTLSSNIAAVRATDLETDQPPAIENGVPPPTGWAGLRWDPANRPWWVEGYALFAWPQRRLSGNDLQQARIGAIRTRQEIVDFFNNGAVARGLVQNGVLVATGETAAQVVARVLGADPSARVPLFTTHAGYVTLNLRGGWRVSPRSSIVVIAENLLDRNYRTMGSGIDGPGFNLQVRHSLLF